MNPGSLGTAAAAGPGARLRTKPGRPPSPAEASELKRAETEIVAKAMGLILQRHESGRVPDHMHYHNSEHTVAVIERARRSARRWA
jgi:hypothetical protein